MDVTSLFHYTMKAGLNPPWGKVLLLRRMALAVALATAGALRET